MSLLALKFFCRNSVFSLEDLNEESLLLDYTSLDERNKPQPSTQIVRWKKQLVQCGIYWDCFHSLLAQKLNRRHWGFFLCFAQIIERLCALPFNANAFLTLKSLIQKCSEKYMKLFPDTNFKPKGHFLKHYSKIIERLDLWLKLSSLRLNTLILKIVPNYE